MSVHWAKRFVFDLELPQQRAAQVTVADTDNAIAHATCMWFMTIVHEGKLAFGVRLDTKWDDDSPLVSTLEELQVFLRKHKLSLLD